MCALISQKEILNWHAQALYTTSVPLFKPYASPHRKTLEHQLQRPQNLTNKSGELKKEELKIITQMTFITKGNKLFYVAFAAFNYSGKGCIRDLTMVDIYLLDTQQEFPFHALFRTTLRRGGRFNDQLSRL